jgi:hypothetical protein
MTTKHYVVEHHGHFISRFCYDVTLLVEDLSSARLFPTVQSARETAQFMSLRLGVHPAELKVRSVYAELDIPHPKITTSAHCTSDTRKAHAIPTQSDLTSTIS